MTRKKCLYMFSTDLIFLQIFSIQSWLNLRMQSPRIWRTDYNTFFKGKVKCRSHFPKMSQQVISGKILSFRTFVISLGGMFYILSPGKTCLPQLIEYERQNTLTCETRS